MIPWLEVDTPFPDVRKALVEEDGAPGLLAAGADLSPARLLDAYRHGIFPWYSEGQPILWWSTDPRMVLPTDELRISHSLAKKLRKTEREMGQPGAPRICFDRNFEGVMRACAQPRASGAGTWISEDIVAGYCGLHAQGHAHSSELWMDGELMAGAYGVAIGRMFYGESMFTRIPDGSKIALVYLVHFLRAQGVKMIDCQQETSHLASLGARPIARSAFLQHLRQAIDQAPIAKWQPLALFGGEQKNFCG